MTEPVVDPAGQEPPGAPAARAPRPWPAVVRYLLAILLGAAVATLTSYLLRKIGL